MDHLPPGSRQNETTQKCGKQTCIGVAHVEKVGVLQPLLHLRHDLLPLACMDVGLSRYITMWVAMPFSCLH